MDLEITILNENYYGDGPHHASIPMTPALAKRIVLLQDTCKKIDASYIEDIDYPTVCDKDGSECEDVHIDNSRMVVSKEDFLWTGEIKHADGVRWETAFGDMMAVREVLKVHKTRHKNLPLLIGALKSKDAQELLETRLKGMKQ